VWLAAPAALTTLPVSNTSHRVDGSVSLAMREVGSMCSWADIKPTSRAASKCGVTTPRSESAVLTPLSSYRRTCTGGKY
jgi:hypothetical protein